MPHGMDYDKGNMKHGKVYGKSMSKDSYSGQRGNVGVKTSAKYGSKGGTDQFFKNRTMQNMEGVGKKLNISRQQPS